MRTRWSSAAPKRVPRPGTRRLPTASSALWRRGLPCSLATPLASRTNLLDTAPPRSAGTALGASAAARLLRSLGGDNRGASRPPRAVLGLSQQPVADTIASMTSRAVEDRADPWPSLGVALALRRAPRPLAADDRGEAKSAKGRGGLRAGRDGNSSARRKGLESRHMGDLDLLCLSKGLRSVGGNRAAWYGDANLIARGDGDCNTASRRDRSPCRGSECDRTELRLGGGCFGWAPGTRSPRSRRRAARSSGASMTPSRAAQAALSELVPAASGSMSRRLGLAPSRRRSSTDSAVALVRPIASSDSASSGWTRLALCPRPYPSACLSMIASCSNHLRRVLCRDLVACRPGAAGAATAVVVAERLSPRSRCGAISSRTLGECVRRFRFKRGAAAVAAAAAAAAVAAVSIATRWL
mmetsp:Transcript_29644/g.58213  ORF Transcript_29644/g.58213 Transcript_29644/m.58213 type:complete len:412 (-) Transcript_29644:599-1834(-)